MRRDQERLIVAVCWIVFTAIIVAMLYGMVLTLKGAWVGNSGRSATESSAYHP